MLVKGAGTPFLSASFIRAVNYARKEDGFGGLLLINRSSTSGSVVLDGFGAEVFFSRPSGSSLMGSVVLRLVSGRCVFVCIGGFACGSCVCFVVWCGVGKLISGGLIIIIVLGGLGEGGWRFAFVENAEREREKGRRREGEWVIGRERRRGEGSGPHAVGQNSLNLRYGLEVGFNA